MCFKFTGTTSYSEQLKKYQKKTGLQEGVVCGLGKIERRRAVSVAVMEISISSAARWVPWSGKKSPVLLNGRDRTSFASFDFFRIRRRP